MNGVSAPGRALEVLADHLVGRDLDDPIAAELLGWLAGSARFRAFAEAHRDKIRKKFRGVTDPDALRDVRAELCAARLLLSDRRVELAFEAYGSGKVGPDLTVTFRGTQRFNLEVTRVRRVPDLNGLGRLLLAKLRQLPPSTPNVVVVAIEGAGAATVDVAATTNALRHRADRKDEAFFLDRGFEGTRGFYERYLRLSGVLVWCERAEAGDRAAWWSNGSARIALPGPAARACTECFHLAA